jgi:hypothetical protein
MGWAEDSFARAQGQQQAAAVAAQRDDPNGPGPLGNFIASAASSIPELFGQAPTEAAAAFRNANPVTGFVSQMLPTLGVYGGVFKLSQLPKAAAALESVVARTGISALERPVAHGFVKELVRYAPFELSRLGVGLATAPSDHYGALFADVGLSTLLAGAGGAVGGYFRIGGKLEPTTGRVVGAAPELKPTFQLRMAQAPEAAVVGDQPLDEVRAALLDQVLRARATDNAPKGAGARYVRSLVDGTPETNVAIEALWRSPTGQSKQVGLRRQLLVEGAESDKTTINFGEQATLAQAAGFEGIEDLAAHVVSPRRLQITSARTAGAFAKLIDESPALQVMDAGVILGREKDSGLFLFLKKTKAGGQAAADAGKRGPKVFGSAKVANGDEYLIGLTDKPQRVVPEAHRIAEINVAEWSKQRAAFQPQGVSFFSEVQNKYLNYMTPGEFSELQKLPRKAWIGRWLEGSGKKLGEMTGLEGSVTLRNTAQGLADAFSPSMFREASDPLYGRVVGMLRGVMQARDGLVNRIMKGEAHYKSSPAASLLKGDVEFTSGFHGHAPVEQLVNAMTPAELQLFHRAATTQTPAEDLAKLSLDGVVSPKVTQAIAELQEINAKVIGEYVTPALKEAGLEDQTKWLEGYVLPRVFSGDWFSQVVDEKGAVQFLANGMTGVATQAQAKAVVEEAAARGLRWSNKQAMTGAQLGVEFEGKELESISKMVMSAMGKSQDTQEIVQQAMRRLSAAAGGKAGLPKAAGAPSSMTKTRTGVAGSSDLQMVTHKEVLDSMRGHFAQLLGYAGQQNWRSRWLPEAMAMGKNSPVLYEDVLRKANQAMGIEGSFTKALNNGLSKVLGGTLGPKAATRIAGETNALMYAWNIGIANPAFALVNLLQPLQTVAPWIAYMHQAPLGELAKHYSLMPHIVNGRVAGVGAGLDVAKILGASLKDLGAPSPEFKAVLQQLKADGTIMPHLYENWVGHDSGTAQTLREVFRQEGGWAGIKKTATWMAEKSEEMSRMVSAAAAYRVGRHSFGLEGDRLYHFVSKSVNVTMYGYGVMDKPRMLTGPLGSTFGLFKNWQFHYISQMAQYAGVAVNHNAWGPLLWQGAAGLAVGGLGATPLKLAADGLASWQEGGGSSYHWLQKNWHEAADEIYFGLPAFLGVSLQSSAVSPGTDVRNDVTSLANVAVVTRAMAIAKALGAASDYNTATGENALRDPRVRDQLLQAVAPRAVFRAFSVAEGDYVKNMTTGDPSIRGVSAIGRMIHGVGLNALEVEREQVASRELYKDHEANKLMVHGLGEQYGQAMMAQDSDEMEAVLARAVARHVPISSLMNSAIARVKRQQEQDVFSKFDKYKVQRSLDALQGE